MYYVINYCEWDGIFVLVQISRDEDCDGIEGEECVWVLVRLDGIFVDIDNDEFNCLLLVDIKGVSCDGVFNLEGYWRMVIFNGYWIYSQCIKMYDNIFVVVLFDDVEVFCIEIVECEIEVIYLFLVIENCLLENFEI